MLITDALVRRQLALYDAAVRGALRACWAARVRARPRDLRTCFEEREVAPPPSTPQARTPR